MTWEEKFAEIKNIAPNANLSMRDPGNWHIANSHLYNNNQTICGDGSTPEEAVEEMWGKLSAAPYVTVGYDNSRYATWDAARSQWIICDSEPRTTLEPPKDE